MPDFQVYFSDNGVAKTGLTPTFDTLFEADGGGAVATGGVTITEIGGGWYNFAGLTIDEKFVGVIDGGAALVNDPDRFVPISLGPEDFVSRVFASAVFNEANDSLKFVAFLEQDGEIVTAGLVDVTIEVFDDSHVSLFSVIQVSATNGTFIVTKSSPGLTKNRIYYAKIEIEDGNGVHTSNDILIAIE